MAMLVPRTWVRIFSETESPATSSEARLMRSPVERRSRDEARPWLFWRRDPLVIIAVMLWLILDMRPSVGI